MTDFPDSKMYESALDPDDVSGYYDRVRQELDSPEEEIQSLLDLLSKADPESTVERIALTANLSAYNSTQTYTEDDGLGVPSNLLEYLIGLFIVAGGSGEEDITTYDLLRAVWRVSDSYMAYKNKEIDNIENDEIKNERNVEFNSVLREVTTGEFMFSDQPLISAKRAYSPHDSYLEDAVGFTIEEAISLTKVLEKISSVRRRWFLNQSDVDPHDVLFDQDSASRIESEYEEKGKIPAFFESDDLKEDADLVERTYASAREHSYAFWFTEDQLIEHSPENISSSTVTQFLDRLSIGIGIESGSLKDFRKPYQFNPIHKHPLIKYNNRYLLANGNLLRHALDKTFYYDLINLPGYGDPTGNTGGEFGDKFGNYVEEWTYDSLTRLFDTDSVFLNPEYPDNNEEAIDVVATWKDCLLVIECKAAKLPLQVRMKSFGSLKSAIDEKIGKANSQISEFLSQINDENVNYLETSQGKLDLDDFNHYRPIIVTGEKYDSFGTKYLDVLLDDVNTLPNLLDAYDFQILCEALDHPHRLVDYLNRRIKMIQNDDFFSPDECDFLGLYIDNGYSFTESPEGYAGVFLKDMTDVVGEEINWKFGL